MAVPMRKCLHSSCRKLIAFTDRYCSKHDKVVSQTYNRDRKKDNPEYIKFYNSVAWRELRGVALIRDEYMCKTCERVDVYKGADMVDHTVPTLVDWDKRLELENLSSMCWSCHNKKTAEENKK